MPKSILEAIKLGLWEYEPPEVSVEEYEATGNMPGTREKLDVLAERVAKGQPLWHPSDREDVEDPDPSQPKSKPRKQGFVNHGPGKPR
ncbi:MAG: hypothetical protein PVH19_02835 [Planctomycetia bacterium]